MQWTKGAVAFLAFIVVAALLDTRDPIEVAAYLMIIVCSLVIYRYFISVLGL